MHKVRQQLKWKRGNYYSCELWLPLRHDFIQETSKTFLATSVQFNHFRRTAQATNHKIMHPINLDLRKAGAFGPWILKTKKSMHQKGDWKLWRRPRAWPLIKSGLLTCCKARVVLYKMHQILFCLGKVVNEECDECTYTALNKSFFVISAL
jgi:hypothetical protein